MYMYARTRGSAAACYYAIAVTLTGSVHFKLTSVSLLAYYLLFFQRILFCSRCRPVHIARAHITAYVTGACVVRVVARINARE